MPEQLPTPCERPLQFRLWWLLGAMTVVAVAATLAAPLLRGYEPVELMLRLVCGAVGIAVFGGGMLVGRRRRYRVTAESGPLRFALPGCRYHPKRQASLLELAPIIAFFAAVAFLVAFQDFATPIVFREVLTVTFCSAAMGLTYGYMIAMASRSRSNYLMALCEHGVSLGNTFVEWEFICNANWLPECPDVLALLLSRDLGRIYLRVTPEERVAIEEFVRTKTKFRG